MELGTGDVCCQQPWEPLGIWYSMDFKCVHLGSPVSMTSPQTCVLLCVLVLLRLGCTWSPLLPLLLRVRKGRGCESVCVAKRINTLMLCPINLLSVRGWLYPPVLQFNGFR